MKKNEQSLFVLLLNAFKAHSETSDTSEVLKTEDELFDEIGNQKNARSLLGAYLTAKNNQKS
ncbi:MAG: hypothetical protein JXQ74_03680 [Alphaproteobacteria bacterium]|nr:hypothetical protein [Alphaproteobacteria bacterium]